MRKLLISFVIFVALSASAHAEWTRGALYGADVRSMVIDPKSPDTFYLGTSQGEIYSSADGAASWHPTRASIPFPGYVVDNLIVDKDSNLWAACWGLWGGGVIAVSTDAGRSWARRDSGLEDFSVRALAIDPKDPKFLVAGGLTGVYRSKDGGKSWDKISDQANVESLAIDPRNANRIWVGTWRQAWRTDDGGKKWSLINNGMVLDTDVFAITLDPKNPDNMWVSTCGWVYNSADGGDSWTRFRDGFNNRRIHDIELDPTSPTALFAGSVAGLYRTEDSGKSWKLISDESLVIRRIGLHPDRPNRVVLAIEGDGVYLSGDNGKTFERSSNGLRNLKVATVVADPAAKDQVYAAVVFGGAASGIYESLDGGMEWKKLSKSKLPEVLSLTIGTDPEVRFVAGTEKGFFWSKDGAEWTQAEPLATPIRVDKVVRFNRTRFFAATSEGVFTSRDAGRKWYHLGETTARAVDLAVGAHSGNPALYALTSSGLVVFDGTTWTPIDGAPSKGRTVAVRGDGDSQIVFIAGAQGVKAGHVDPEHKWRDNDAPDALYAAVYGSQRGEGRMLFLSSREHREILLSEAGADWRALPLPTNNTEVAAICADPFDADRYYVGTVGEGVFVFTGKPLKFSPKIVAAADAYSTGGGSK
jgi:photosystem II stability/assembly factor-like uncharacterized protein